MRGECDSDVGPERSSSSATKIPVTRGVDIAEVGEAIDQEGDEGAPHQS